MQTNQGNLLMIKGNSQQWIPLVLFYGVCLLCWQALKFKPETIPPTMQNKAVPSFQATTLQNQTFTQKSFLKNKVTILHIWSSWCPICKQEHNFWVQLGKGKNQHLDLISLNFKDDKVTALQWLKKHHNPYRSVIYDPKGTLALNFGIIGTPETLLIDAQGIIRYVHVGAMNKTLWDHAIAPRIKTWINTP
jgi:cytochrome c biogenesis protein CcmG, thiol:disulfide interchange protein DsbE